MVTTSHMTMQPKFLDKSTLESKAEELLAAYLGGTLLERAQPIDIYHFAEFELEASVDYQPLSEDGLTLGMSVFQEGSVPIYKSPGVMVDTVFPAKTIIIDSEALESSPESRERFTVAHECAHQVLHPRYFYRDPHMNTEATTYRPYQANAEQHSESFDRTEWQANYLGAALLMPRRAFAAKFSDLTPNGWMRLSPAGKKCVVSNLAETFEVSRMATALRIKNIKLVK